MPRNVYSGREATAANISICYINGNNGKVLLCKYLPSTWAMIARGPRDYLFLHARGKRRTERDTHTLNSRIEEFFQVTRVTERFRGIKGSRNTRGY